MKGVELMRSLQMKMQLPDIAVAHCRVLYEKAVSRRFDQKHGIYVLTCAVLYLYARRNGLNITMARLCNHVPVTREEVMNAYEDLRRVF